MVDTPKKESSRKLWWLVIAVYFLLLAATGYVAFIARDSGLEQQISALATNMPDEQTRAAVFKALKDESVEREIKAETAAHAFHVILGSILGFLSASAVTAATRKGER